MHFADFARRLPEYVTQRARFALDDIDDATADATGRATYRTAMGFAVEIQRASDRHHDLDVLLRMDLAKFAVDAHGEVYLGQLLLSLNGRVAPYRLSISDSNTVRVLQNFKVDALTPDALCKELDDFVQHALLTTALLFEYADNRRQSDGAFFILSPDNFIQPIATDGPASCPPSNDAITRSPVKPRTLLDIQTCIDAEIDTLGSGIPNKAFADRLTALVDAFYRYRFEFDKAGSVALRVAS